MIFPYKQTPDFFLHIIPFIKWLINQNKNLDSLKNMFSFVMIFYLAHPSNHKFIVPYHFNATILTLEQEKRTTIHIYFLTRKMLLKVLI